MSMSASGDICSFLKLALEAAFDHEILREDEYLKSFLFVEMFSDCVELIKNVEPPVQVKKESFYGGKWPSPPLKTRVVN